MDLSFNRKEWMSLLAKSSAEKLAERFDKVIEALTETPDFSWLRKPEIGGVMVQGRAGSTGAPFNMGEVTVTRCSLQLSSGEVGHAYVQGRNKKKAEQSALVDAYMQTDRFGFFMAGILEPISNDLDKERTAREAKAGKTKVDFFTLVRGED
tara:strand:+ start:2233 stop:2688 length:456 start_codon:yes stop_codon:yes gene_type:complete